MAFFASAVSPDHRAHAPHVAGVLKGERRAARSGEDLIERDVSSFINQLPRLRVLAHNTARGPLSHNFVRAFRRVRHELLRRPGEPWLFAVDHLAWLEHLELAAAVDDVLHLLRSISNRSCKDAVERAESVKDAGAKLGLNRALRYHEGSQPAIHVRNERVTRGHVEG